MSNQDQAVREWMESLGFKRSPGQHGYYRIQDGDKPLFTFDDEALFFYTICQKAEREARLDEFMAVTGIFNASGVELSPRFSAMQLRDKLLDHQKQLQAQTKEENGHED